MQKFVLTLDLDDLGKLYTVFKKSPEWSSFADLALSTAMDAIFHNIEQSEILDEDGERIGESNEMSVVDAMTSFGFPIIEALQEAGMPLFEPIYPIPDPDMCKRSLLMHAIEADQEDLVDKILELGKTSGMSGWIEIGEEDGRSPLYVCTVSDYSAHFKKYIKVLIDAGANTEAINFDYTSDETNLELIKLGLVKEGRNIVKVLEVYRYSKHINALLEALVKSGWDINQKLPFDCSWNCSWTGGTSVLAYAVEKEWPVDNVKWLIDHGADTKLTGGLENSENLLMLACRRYKDAWQEEDRKVAFEILKLLMGDQVREARVTGMMQYIRTDVHILHFAAQMGSMELAQYVLDKGADRNVVAVNTPRILNFEGKTPRDFAIEAGHSDIVKLLS
jgi:hypothetical protein